MIKKTKYGTNIQIVKNLKGQMVMVTALTKTGQFTTIVKADDIEDYKNELENENREENTNQLI